MSENSDAVVVIVSEETGTVSVAYEGKLKRNFSRESLTEELRSYLMVSESSVQGKGFVRIPHVIMHKSGTKNNEGGKGRKLAKKTKSANHVGIINGFPRSPVCCFPFSYGCM